MLFLIVCLDSYQFTLPFLINSFNYDMADDYDDIDVMTMMIINGIKKHDKDNDHQDKNDDDDNDIVNDDNHK